MILFGWIIFYGIKFLKSHSESSYSTKSRDPGKNEWKKRQITFIFSIGIELKNVSPSPKQAVCFSLFYPKQIFFGAQYESLYVFHQRFYGTLLCHLLLCLSFRRIVCQIVSIPLPMMCLQWHRSSLSLHVSQDWTLLLT